MTTAHYYGFVRPRRAGPFEAMSSAFASAFDAVRRYLRMRRAIGELRELDDRMLSDIGLSRSTLYFAARDVHGFGTGTHAVR